MERVSFVIQEQNKENFVGAIEDDSPLFSCGFLARLGNGRTMGDSPWVAYRQLQGRGIISTLLSNISQGHSALIDRCRSIYGL